MSTLPPHGVTTMSNSNFISVIPKDSIGLSHTHRRSQQEPHNTTMHSGGPVNLTLPREMTFNDDNLVSVIAYSCLFLIAATGNLTVFITLFRSRGFKSRVNSFIMHLSVADLIVAFVMLPMETAWHITVSWKAGDFACRLMMFFRAFGFYLSSFTLVTISLDRYFSIVHPMSLHDAERRGKIMLTVAWTLSVVASLPQSVIFHVEQHPVFTWFEQCVTFNFFPSQSHELAYNLFNVITVYVMPLVVITTSYCLILCKIYRNSTMVKGERHILRGSRGSRGTIRCSSAGKIGKAKIRTLKMTLVIVSVFILCWTPYFFMAALWWFDRDAASKVDPKVQRGLFLFAVSNACMDPIVYGMFTATFRREAKKWSAYVMWKLSKIHSANNPRRRDQDCYI
ncbi:adipokinetic hormone/corazonin-related peptide receptor variant I isoform X2 [Patella vulgata]|uniref:adipokinetic hormone/corazonin-related peptide receptor variant I isoform X2 n=1 Tax=Patella vulgata TaxID=6465 RepID=UPI00217F57FA|nr:adipokinetic hormone/corazonin-related peptide receptor variant I isoform X2 [Patella vulgata]